MEIPTVENETTLQKVFRWLAKRPVLVAAIVLYSVSWMGLFIHLLGMPILLGGMLFYIYTSRFNEGRYYERALQESKHHEIEHAPQRAHEDTMKALKTAVGIGTKS
jgi:hypothetical protein